MDKLDKFISENRELFNESEPDHGHFKRFSEKLDHESGTRTFRIKRALMLKIAAGILVFITATVLVFDLGVKHLRNSFETYNAGTGLTDETENAMNYYDGLTKNRLGEFNKLACCGEEKVHLNSLVSSELNNLDANIAELKQVLRNNPDNERIQAALIQNQQMKNQVLDNMINQMKKKKIVKSEK
jgi:hypothetical protein